MNIQQEQFLLSLARKERWTIEEKAPAEMIRGGGRFWMYLPDGEKYELMHPYLIWLKRYRDAVSGDDKYEAMVKVHHYLWPHHIETWNYWTERRFRAHCDDWKMVVMAGGAGIGKSVDGAKIGLIFWLSDPHNNACIISSTTLESLESRIWGYAANLAQNCAIPVPLVVLRGKPPRIMHPAAKDKIHGMFAVAIRTGEDDKTLSTVIGRHPNKRLMVFLDESTELSPAIIKAIPNWEKGIEFLQVWPIGNSNDRNDLHGSLATPRIGWENINPERNYVWETNYDKGICLYFNPSDSPAIKETDPIKKAALSKFLITEEGIAAGKIQYGEESEAYWRFTLGFWRPQGIDSTIITKPFLTENEVFKSAEWSGFYKIEVVAGLDPAYQVGGTGCLLRLAYLGHTVNGPMVLDYRKDELIFRIDIQVTNIRSGELQLAQEVIRLLRIHGCPLRNVAIDVTGSGRALGELIKIVAGSAESPLKIVSVGKGGLKPKKDDPQIITCSPTDAWFNFKNFVQNGQIRGLDLITIQQMCSRLLFFNNNIMKLETKDEYKTRMQAINPKLAHSPDEADSAILASIAAVLRFGFRAGMRRELPNAGIDDFWAQKTAVLEYERKERLAKEIGAVEEPGIAQRFSLLPNFARGVEDIVGPGKK